jgi:hypothetical protein
VAVDRTQWPGYLCSELNLGVSEKAEYFVNNWATVSFSWKISVTWVIHEHHFALEILILAK